METFGNSIMSKLDIQTEFLILNGVKRAEAQFLNILYHFPAKKKKTIAFSGKKKIVAGKSKNAIKIQNMTKIIEYTKSK